MKEAMAAAAAATVLMVILVMAFGDDGSFARTTLTRPSLSRSCSQIASSSWSKYLLKAER